MRKLLGILIVILCLTSCADDNEVTNQPLDLSFTELLIFEADTLDMDMVSDVIENAVFVSYSDNNGLSETILKYNIGTATQSTHSHFDNSGNRQLEIIDGMIYSFSANNNLIKLDLNLGNETSTDEFYEAYNHRMTTYNNSILFISGTPSLNNEMLIKQYDPSTQSFSQFGTFPYIDRVHSDGEVFGNNLYVFGGNNGVSNFNEINIYDLNTLVWTQQTLPFPVYESFTALHNDKIIVSGNKNADGSGAFIGSYDTATAAFTELNTSLDMNMVSIRSITVINNELFIAYTDLINPAPSIYTVRLAKSSL